MGDRRCGNSAFRSACSAQTWAYIFKCHSFLGRRSWNFSFLFYSENYVTGNESFKSFEAVGISLSRKYLRRLWLDGIYVKLTLKKIFSVSENILLPKLGFRANELCLFVGSVSGKRKTRLRTKIVAFEENLRRTARSHS